MDGLAVGGGRIAGRRRGRARRRDHRKEPAVRLEAAIWQNAVHNYPNCSRSHYNLGNALLRNRSYADAATQFQLALEKQPIYREADVRTNLGLAYMNQNNMAAAIPQLQRVVELEPQAFDARNDLAAIMFQLGRIDDAIAEYQRAVKLQPQNSVVLCNLGMALLMKGDTDGAIEQFRQALRASPGDPRARSGLKEALRRRKKKQPSGK